MKYKQICPDCNEEFVLESKDDIKKRCPNCKSTAIWSRKLIPIEKFDESIVAPQKDEIVENTGEKIYSMSDFVSEHGITINSKSNSCITLKYSSKQGKIKHDFEIKIDDSDGECCIGRDNMGKEHLQYDTRVSNEHLYIINQNRKWLIWDEKSTNGTMLNKEILEKRHEYEVKNGDIIVLGTKNDSVQFMVIIDENS